MIKRLTVWVMTQALVLVQTTAIAQTSHDQGAAAGRAANTTIRGMVNQPSATGVVPGYTTTPPETALAGRPALGPEISAKLAGCATTPNDPSCQALRTAITSANTARPSISLSDPAIVAASLIANNPSLALGSLSSYYSGCTTNDVALGPGTTTKLCRVYSGIGNITSRRDLNVEVALAPSCVEGAWFVTGKAWRNGSDYMIAEAQCGIRTDGLQRFRFHAAGGNGSCIGMQEVDLPVVLSTSPVVVTDLSPHWSGGCWAPFKVVMDGGSGCNDDLCIYRFDFGTPTDYACPEGTVAGNTIVARWSGDTMSAGPPDQCFKLAAASALECSGSSLTFEANGAPYCAIAAGAPTVTAVSGWRIQLSFRRPAMAQVESDVWVDRMSAIQPESRCTISTDERCVDGPSIKQISGRPVSRSCWSYETTMSCSGAELLDECAPLAAQGCTTITSRCLRRNATTDACEEQERSLTCPSVAQTVTTASNCPSNVFCLGTSCFNTAYTSDADFARTMSMLEAGREAGVYFDSDRMQVFKGEANNCRHRLLTNCCNSDASGRGMTNQSVFGAGSRLVYDILMNSENRKFVYQGLSALLTGAGFSGSFASYGVTIAVNGTALPAGSTVLYSSSSAAGEGFVVAFDPWTLTIAATIYIVLSLTSCNENEAMLALKEGAGLCHSIGSYCSSCIRILGSCVSCIEHTTGKCCFNSMLARIVNEQGRGQISKGWGDARNPDCSGFSIAQLQSLDFARMDLSEFYASLVAKSPNLSAIQTNNGSRVPSCYFGQGKC